MSDVLVVTAPLGARYPSQNHTGADGARFGKKSPEYHDLFAAVADAARAEIERTGWACASFYVEASCTLYRRADRIDPSNVGKCEFDALTAAGAWASDKLARPVHLEVEIDPEGDERVVLVLRRRYPQRVPKPSLAERVRLEARSAAPKRTPAAAAPPAADAPPSKGMPRVAWRDGKPIPYEQAMKELGLR